MKKARKISEPTEPQASKKQKTKTSKLDPDTIYFYTLRNRWGFFSNFYRAAIVVDGKRWPTSEHYYQAQKHVGTPHAELVRNAKTPAQALDLGCDESVDLRDDWDDVKLDVMRKAIYEKFTQHPELKKKLLETGNQKIVEHTRNDTFWADGLDGSGHNWLGVLLMELREKLRKEDEKKQTKT